MFYQIGPDIGSYDPTLTCATNSEHACSTCEGGTRLLRVATTVLSMNWELHVSPVESGCLWFCSWSPAMGFQGVDFASVALLKLPSPHYRPRKAVSQFSCSACKFIGRFVGTEGRTLRCLASRSGVISIIINRRILPDVPKQMQFPQILRSVAQWGDCNSPCGPPQAGCYVRMVLLVENCLVYFLMRCPPHVLPIQSLNAGRSRRAHLLRVRRSDAGLRCGRLCCA